MAAPNHYHDRIQRATQQLAQLQARELLAIQRQAAREKETARRQEARRRHRVADIVFLTDAQTLEDPELVGALLAYLKERRDPSIRDRTRELGAARLKDAPTAAAQAKTH